MKKLLCILLLIGLLTGCNSSPEYEKYSSTTIDSGFDTVIQLIGYTTSEKEFDKYFETLKSKFGYYNQLFDRYNEYEGVNNIYTINANAGIKPVEVDADLMELLVLSKKYYDFTNGAFDITMGATLEIWHNYRDKGQSLNEQGDDNTPVPSKNELLDTLYLSGFEHIQLDETNNTVYIDEKGISLDVGGIAKGFATEKVAQILENDGLKYGAINGGGNVRIIGGKPDGSNWTIGVTSPSDTNTNVAVFTSLGDVSFVTSGDYQRYYISQGKSYGHIIDPSTLYPATHFRSVTIVTKDSALADIMSTAIFVLSYEDGLMLVDQYNQDNPDNQIGVFWVCDKDKKPEDKLGLTIDDFYVIPTNNVRNDIDIFGANN